ncbi:uncharacterized protein [Amphiura filiformis]|uniref:uncharacterized protein n=1 Tax=Amphiura filiformis TaxID=82378 RepID=UPI003B21AA14
MVPRKIVHQLVPAVLKARCGTVGDGDQQKVTGISFRTETGTKYRNVAWNRTQKDNTIQSCEDWQVVWDEDNRLAMFPPEIVITSKRPDITVYSPSDKQGVIIEFTAEENLAQANRKYEDLTQEGQSAGWELKYFPVEVGSRGLTNNTLRTCFKFFGLKNKETK